jgi:hypothetical protein
MVVRSPISVAQQIKDVTPVKYHTDIDWYINDFSYKAPEQVGDCFRALTEFCWETLFNKQEYLPNEWQIKVASILSTRPEDEIRLYNQGLKK